MGPTRPHAHLARPQGSFLLRHCATKPRSSLGYAYIRVSGDSLAYQEQALEKQTCLTSKFTSCPDLMRRDWREEPVCADRPPRRHAGDQLLDCHDRPDHGLLLHGEHDVCHTGSVPYAPVLRQHDHQDEPQHELWSNVAWGVCFRGTGLVCRCMGCAQASEHMACVSAVYVKWLPNKRLIETQYADSPCLPFNRRAMVALAESSRSTSLSRSWTA